MRHGIVFATEADRGGELELEPLPERGGEQRAQAERRRRRRRDAVRMDRDARRAALAQP